MADQQFDGDLRRKKQVSSPGGVTDHMVINDGAAIADILRSTAFEVVTYADHYRAINKKTGLDFDATVNALDMIPLANEGKHHKTLRSRAAAAIATDRKGNAEAMDQYIAALVSRAFTVDAEIELRNDIALPIFNHLYALWTGVALEAELNVSQVFCGRMSLNRRIEINSGIKALAETDSGGIRVPPDVAVTFGILGSDALVGSLALSLWEEFSRNEGMPIADIVFPECIPSSSVPYIDRVAKEDTEVAGKVISEGQRVRLMLDATTFHASGQEQDLLFGKGRHLCLGKPMSQAIWRSLVKALGAVRLRTTPLEMRLRARDYVFCYPQFAKMRIHD